MKKSVFLSAVLSLAAGFVSVSAAGLSKDATQAADGAKTVTQAVGCVVVDSAAAGPVADSAGDRAAGIVSALAAEFRAMNGYEVAFEIAMGEHRMAGSYSVEGERYCLRLGDAEVFGDGTTRYEVDHRRREITVVGIDSVSRSLLDNPVHAFDFLDSGYLPALSWERDGLAAVSLQPVAGSGSLAGTIALVVATATMRPQSVVYDFDGEKIEIRILRISLLRSPFRTFDPDACAGFEWIDFR
ncbi:MAG: hypothetical protein NC209_03130 [Alistipes sp.]|nr:hypothetical protein [Alistipes senegalensis]MCM1250123.1 hypothetical protein [Alistipes sp.]